MSPQKELRVRRLAVAGSDAVFGNGMKRTLEQALARAELVRRLSFPDDLVLPWEDSEAFDLVLLADEVKRLREIVVEQRGET